MSLTFRALRGALGKAHACERSFSSAPCAASRPESQEENDVGRTQRKVHPYKGVGSWSTQKELIEELKAHILYKDEHILILNKPYGLLNYGYSGTRRDRGVHRALYAGTAAPDRFNLHQCIPELEQMVEMADLRIVKTVDRYCSGPVILATPPAVDDVKKCWARDRFCRSYMAVTVGSPNPPAQDVFKFVVAMETVKMNRDEVEQRPIISMEFAKDRKKREDRGQNLFSCKYSTASTANGASLVYLEMSSAKRNSIRLITSRLVSPILGDDIFGGRTKRVLGVPMPVSVHNRASDDPQELPEKMRAKLKVPDKHGFVPLHLHSSAVRLPRYRGEDFEIFAPPPVHFIYSLRQLKLISDAEILKMLKAE